MSMLSRWTIGRDRVEEGEGAFAGLGGDGFGELRAGERAGGDDRRMIGQGIDALAHNRDVRVLLDRARDFGGECLSVDRERGTRGNAMLVAGAHDQRTERAHLLVEQPDRIVLGIVGAEAVRADHFGEPVGLVRRSRVAAAAHFAQADAHARFGELPGSLGAGESAADDVDVETSGHFERSEAIHGRMAGLPRACGARNDGSGRLNPAHAHLHHRL